MYVQHAPLSVQGALLNFWRPSKKLGAETEFLTCSSARKRERGLFKSDMVLIHVTKAKFHFLQILILGEVFCTFCGW